jgi:hypothetical protein
VSDLSAKFEHCLDEHTGILRDCEIEHVTGGKSRSRNSAQGDRWNFCLTAGTLWPANQERPCRNDRAGITHRA